ncbi:hypothetical protein AB1Y20_017081 [Prymnesium parvum]|uniref:Peptidase A2 domain-containing protein n=1 Tax=Prymnesium parvum TaxID=97485 RepID=A0AB34IBG1_PRYPA
MKAPASRVFRPWTPRGAQWPQTGSGRYEQAWEPSDCAPGRDALQPGETRVDTESDTDAEGLDDDDDRSFGSTSDGRSCAAALAAVLTVATLAAGVTHSYGPGDEATRHQCLLAHRQAQEQALRGRNDVGGASNDKLEEEAAIDDVPETPGQWLDESFPLHFENLAFQVGENTIRRVKDAICDSGASFNVVDENTARHNEKRTSLQHAS